jgi:hypothetical protein
VRAATRSLTLVPLALLLFAVACTGGGRSDRTDTPSAVTSSPTPVGPVRFLPGGYRYAFGGVTATLTFTGSDATMDVKNASGAELAPPGVYVIDGGGARHDGTITDAASIPDGASATFALTFPPDVTPKTIGLVILEFGDSNWGAFAPAPAA